MLDANVESVIAKHRARAEAGLKKYGVTTERTDLTLRQRLQHLQDELMDAAVYVERLLGDVKADEAMPLVQRGPGGEFTTSEVWKD